MMDYTGQQQECLNPYELMFERANVSGLGVADAVLQTAEAYLNGKPARRGKSRISWAERHHAFWNSRFLATLPADTFLAEPMVLAISSYMNQEQTTNFEIIQYIASVAPEAVRRAVRYSGLVLRQESQRWKEIERLVDTTGTEFEDIIRICHTFDRAHRERVAEVKTLRSPLTDLLPLELFSYASLYAFEHLIPAAYMPDQFPETDTQDVWQAINDILLWKLENTADEAFHLNVSKIGKSLHDHLSPFLFPSPEFPKTSEVTYEAFKILVAAQIELNSFLSQSVDAFCYDDSIRFQLKQEKLVIIKHDPDAHATWTHNGEKLGRLHVYWFYRAMNAFAESDMAMSNIGRPENHEMNRLVYIKALRIQLQLTEVYGLSHSVKADSGLRVDLFQALLSLELMTAFFNVDFILPYLESLEESGNWRFSLMRLAMNGLLQTVPQNRFPLTFSEQKEKIKNIRPWTVSNDFPHGNLKAAEAILDFWTNDLGTLSRWLRTGKKGSPPELYERPILKMGRFLFQLPWMMGMQNNASAAINNLRRIGARREEAREETRRIETQLANAFKNRGFQVCLNYHPPTTSVDNPGEIDLICVRDGYLLVLEVKSTYLRKSLKEAWLHKTMTLRKAGLQLRRKVNAVHEALSIDTELNLQLGLNLGTDSTIPHGWIVDTSIEHDHEFFSGFLKVSLEEILIALRDDHYLLNDPDGIFRNQHTNLDDVRESAVEVTPTLYPDGFSGGYFVDTILRQAVWTDSVK